MSYNDLFLMRHGKIPAYKYAWIEKAPRVPIDDLLLSPARLHRAFGRF
jgi:hypothetical protein